jgi:hypothetical protein
MDDCTISGNAAAHGGGIWNGPDGTLSMTNCTVSGNFSRYGGGLYLDGGSATITGSTFSGNSAVAPDPGPLGISGQGGGILLGLGATGQFTDCTVAGNAAALQGGGIFNLGPSQLDLVACTVSGNTADSLGGGLYTYPYSGSAYATLSDTIIAGNTTPNGPSDIAGADAGLVTGSYNLIGTGGSGGLSASDHNLLGVADPGLAPLGDYGGPTLTMALQPGSPARHAGAFVPGVTTDQRGFPLDSPTDIGAFQAQPGPLVVDTVIDGLGSGLGQLSLRQAVNLADVLNGGATITFDKAAFASKSVITLTAGPLELSNATGPVTITGPGLGKLAVSGGGASRVFQVDPGASAALSGLTITGGVTTGDGGGLLNQGTVALAGVDVVGNAAANGGGIANSGTAVIAGSAIDGNAASVNGGGIFNTGFLSLAQSHLSANSAATDGGGLFNRGTAALVYCIVSDNSAAAGGGVYADPAGQPVVLLGTKVGRNKGGNIFGRVIIL